MLFSKKKFTNRLAYVREGRVPAAPIPGAPPAPAPPETLIRFEGVSLSPAIESLSLEIPRGAWLTLYGADDFAKALFCDLCFGYIYPERGRVQPALRGSDVSFLGRSNTTYGNTLADHLQCGVREASREAMLQVAAKVFSRRLHRHLSARNPLEFRDEKKAAELELDERDFLEIAEANLLLQKRRAAVIDTTSDFYQIGLEQGFRHSAHFLAAGKTILWLVGENPRGGTEAQPWLRAEPTVPRIGLTFPPESPAGYLN